MSAPVGTLDLRIAPTSLSEACRWVEMVHRHHAPPRGHRASVSVVDGAGTLHGVAIIGRPVSRILQAAGYLEVTRVATDGTPNAASMLYGAARRIGTALGYPVHRIITYTLAEEPGTSLVAAGWVRDGQTRGGSWDRPGRAREDRHPTGAKMRWAAGVTS